MGLTLLLLEYLKDVCIFVRRLLTPKGKIIALDSLYLVQKRKIQKQIPGQAHIGCEQGLVCS